MSFVSARVHTHTHTSRMVPELFALMHIKQTYLLSSRAVVLKGRSPH